MRKLGLVFLITMMALLAAGCSTQEDVEAYKSKVTGLEEEVKQLKIQNNQLRVQNDQMKNQTKRLSEQLRSRSKQPGKTVPASSTDSAKNDNSDGE